jgi:predicted acetyltransferase
MRLGSAAVKMGAIAEVETRRRFRKKGYMRALMEDTVRYLADRGDVMSVVFGIPDFYYRFGYVSCIPSRALSVYTRVAEKAGNTTQNRRFRARKARRADAEKLLAIYDRNTKGRMCTLVRDADYFAGYAKAGQEVVVVENGRRQLSGYAVYNRKGSHLRVAEVAASDARAYPLLMRRLASVAIKRRVGNFLFDLAPGDPFAEFCHRHGCQWTRTYHKNAHTMMQIINQERLFRAMRRDLERRVHHSHFARSSARLTLKTGLAATTLKIGKGKLELASGGKRGTTISMPEGHLTQLVVGYRSAGDVLDAAGVRVGERSRRVLATLFPPDHPQIWNGHRFEERHLGPDDFPLSGHGG